MDFFWKQCCGKGRLKKVKDVEQQSGELCRVGETSGFHSCRGGARPLIALKTNKVLNWILNFTGSQWKEYRCDVVVFTGVS